MTPSIESAMLSVALRLTFRCRFGFAHVRRTFSRRTYTLRCLVVHYRRTCRHSSAEEFQGAAMGTSRLLGVINALRSTRCLRYSVQHLLRKLLPEE
jgi:hypothetical protein